jgi:uncharacterized DUF497 family protein
MTTSDPSFEWDLEKERANRAKHGIGFGEARKAFFDPRRVIAEDLDHSGTEQRYFCFGRVGGGVMTVRFTYREKRIRIFGAGRTGSGLQAIRMRLGFISFPQFRTEKWIPLFLELLSWRKGRTIYERENGPLHEG